MKQAWSAIRSNGTSLSLLVGKLLFYLTRGIWPRGRLPSKRRQCNEGLHSGLRALQQYIVLMHGREPNFISSPPAGNDTAVLPSALPSRTFDTVPYRSCLFYQDQSSLTSFNMSTGP